MLVEDDESFNVVNELGLENLVAVRASALDSNTTNTSTTTANPNGDVTVTPQLGLTTEVSKPTSEVNVYILTESEDGLLVTRRARAGCFLNECGSRFFFFFSRLIPVCMCHKRPSKCQHIVCVECISQS